jgi:hypothetical protein
MRMLVVLGNYQNGAVITLINQLTDVVREGVEV